MASENLLKQKTSYPYLNNVQVTYVEHDDCFPDLGNYKYPFYKMTQHFYFGGVKHPKDVPVSMPHRVII